MTFRERIERWLEPGITELTPHTRALMEQAIEVLPQITHHFDMAEWAVSYDDCGTACCVGGLMELLHRGYEPSALDGEIAEDLLDIHVDFRSTAEIPLFERTIYYTDDWDRDLRDRYRNAQTDADRTSAGVDALKRFLSDYDAIYQEKVGK